VKVHFARWEYWHGVSTEKMPDKAPSFPKFEFSASHWIESVLKRNQFCLRPLIEGSAMLDQPLDRD
jgi:hypothetical protein